VSAATAVVGDGTTTRTRVAGRWRRGRPVLVVLAVLLAGALLAILPAVFVTGLRGNGSVTDLLTLSQVVLALQLPFAMFPLLHFTSSRKRMGFWRNGRFLLLAGWASAILITVMDVYGLPDALRIAWHVVSGG